MSVERSDVDRGGVYIIRNIINNKIYVGSTVNFRKRFKEHIWALIKNTHYNGKLQNSFNTHKKENFLFNPIIICEREELEYYENKVIDLYNPEYNINNGCKRRVGYIFSEEARKNMSLSHIGKPSNKKGSTISEEQKKLLREVNIGNENGSKDFSHIRLVSPTGYVVQLGRNLEKFCRENNLNSSLLNMVITNKRHSHGGWTVEKGVKDVS